MELDVSEFQKPSKKTDLKNLKNANQTGFSVPSNLVYQQDKTLERHNRTVLISRTCSRLIIEQCLVEFNYKEISCTCTG